MSSISLATRTLLRRTAASTGGTLPSAAAVSSSSVRPASTLQETLAEQVPGKQVALASLKKEHGGKVIGNVTIDQLIGGARGVKCMLWETSNLDPEEGIRFRGLTIPECQEVSLRIQLREGKEEKIHQTSRKDPAAGRLAPTARRAPYGTRAASTGVPSTSTTKMNPTGEVSDVKSYGMCLPNTFFPLDLREELQHGWIPGQTRCDGATGNQRVQTPA